MNKLKLTPQEIEAFYREMGVICCKYGVTGMAGIWFGTGEQMGQLGFYDVADHYMKELVLAMNARFEQWAGDALPKMDSMVTGSVTAQSEHN